MTQENDLTAKPLHPISLFKLMLVGGGIALALIIFFLATAGEPNPKWPKLWRLKPLIIVPLAGGCGGVFYYLMDHLRYKGGWRKIVANVFSLLVFIIGLWLGIVLGLNGTYWN